MARKARLDALGTLHHVIIRGIERRPIVMNWGSSLRLTLVEKYQRSNVNLTLNFVFVNCYFLAFCGKVFFKI